MTQTAGMPGVCSWWVLHSRPRCEKKIRQRLESVAEEVYLPCRASRRDYQSKSVTFQVPLFSGYVFARFPVWEKSRMLAAAPIARLIPVADQVTFIRQLNALKSLLRKTQDVFPCPFITLGSKVKITSGRFKGIEGMVVRNAGKDRLVLSIDFLQQSVEVELETDRISLAA